MLKIFLLPISTTYTLFDEQFELFLPKNRFIRLHSFIHDSDKKNCLLSYLFVCFCLWKTYNIDYDDLIFDRLDNKKPFLVSHPNIHFNLSHTKGFICCAISDKACGIDVETCTNALPEIIDIAFSASEKKFISTLDKSSVSYNYNFYKIWTLKEAYTKQLGTGLFTNFSEINTLSDYIKNNSYTFQKDKYIISIYHNVNESVSSDRTDFLSNTQSFKEEDIYNYFLSLDALN